MDGLRKTVEKMGSELMDKVKEHDGDIGVLKEWSSQQVRPTLCPILLTAWSVWSVVRRDKLG